MNAAEQFAEDALRFAQATSGMAKTPDTAEQFAAYHGVMKHALIAAGEALYKPWPRCDRPAVKISDIEFSPGRQIHATIEKRTPRVGFFMPTATLLAHSRNLLTYLDALADYGAGTRDKTLSQRAIIPIVYTFAAAPAVGAEFSQAFSRHTVRHVGHEGSALSHWAALREAAIGDDLDAMVFVSVAHGMAFATSYGVAPKHIWWAHKWHGLDVPGLGLNGYIDACHPFVEGPIEIGGQRWRSTYTALPELFDASKQAAALELRASLEVATVFGWMGRQDKITPEYLGAVCDILHKTPDSIYVYTGHNDSQAIAAGFNAAELADRVAYIGWVDVSLWAQVIDVYLDTFPFQSGHSAYAVMAAGKPVVWLHDEETAKEQSASGLIVDTWDKGANVIFGNKPWTTSIEEYVDRALFYSGSDGPAEEYGSAGRQWLERFLMDRRRMATSVTRAILEIVEN